MNSKPTDSNSPLPSSELLSNDSTPEHFGVLRNAKPTRGWVPIPRDLINDQRLHFDTRAIASWLLSRREGWQIRLCALPRVLQRCAGPGEHLGRDRIRRCLRELEDAGYLTRTRSRTPGGRWVWCVELRDSSEPRSAPATVDGSAVDGSPVDGSAVDGQGIGLSNTLSSMRSDFIEPTTTTTPATAAKANTEPVVVVPMMEIRFPECLKERLLPSARHLIDACPSEYRQAILDEIGAMHAAGKVSYPIGLLRSLIESAKGGRFVPNRSLTVPPPGSIRTIPEARPKPITPPPGRLEPLSDIGERTLSQLRERLKHQK